MERWMFGENADELLNKVIERTKTATSSLYSGEKPEIGEKSIIINSSNQNKCIIEIVDYKILNYAYMTEEFAILEGEGNLEDWKSIHKRFFSKELDIMEENFDEETKILFEIFKVVKIFE